jgi:Putative motility protein
MLPLMDIAGLASSLSQAQVQSSIDIAVAKKSMDVQKQQGAAIVQMLDAAQDIAKSNTNAGVNGLDLYA